MTFTCAKVGSNLINISRVL